MLLECEVNDKSQRVIVVSPDSDFTKLQQPANSITKLDTTVERITTVKMLNQQ